MIFHWSLCDRKSPQLSITFPEILIQTLINAIVWMVSVRPSIFDFSSPLSKALGTIKNSPITIGINVTLIFPNLIQFSSKVQVLVLLSFISTQWSIETAKSSLRQAFSAFRCFFSTHIHRIYLNRLLVPQSASFFYFVLAGVVYWTARQTTKNSYLYKNIRYIFILRRRRFCVVGILSESSHISFFCGGEPFCEVVRRPENTHGGSWQVCLSDQRVFAFSPKLQTLYCLSSPTYFLFMAGYRNLLTSVFFSIICWSYLRTEISVILSIGNKKHFFLSCETTL